MTNVATAKKSQMGESLPANAEPRGTKLAAWVQHLSIINIVILGLTGVYAYLFVKSIAPYWFNPRWTTDDGVQQLFPFFSVLQPDFYKGDLIYDVMLGYLAPIHYGVGYVLTLLTKDPIMTGHYMMLIQLVLSLVFLFLAVKKVAGIAPALFSVLWLLHTRSVLQRLTAGLPRGWAIPLIAGYFYFVMSGKHRCVILLLLAGCLLNPPATFLIAAAYGALLLFQIIRKSTRAVFLPYFIRLVIAAPILAGVTLWVTKRPPEIGHVLSLSEASQLPEFSRKGGRFSFLPFEPWQREIREFSLRPFLGKRANPPEIWVRAMPWLVSGLLILLVGFGIHRKRNYIPLELLSFGVAALVVYFISRPLAFYLYVPDRHLNIPIAMFLIAALSVGVWRLLHREYGAESASSNSSSLRVAWGSALGLCALGLIVYSATGLGLRGDMNFNYTNTKRGYFPTWLKLNTPESSLIAGHPTLIDPVPLYSKRRILASSETWHPFYSAYNVEMKRRLSIELAAHYAKSLSEMVQILEPEGVDYFVFQRNLFYPKKLSEAGYFQPLNQSLRQKIEQNKGSFAYRELPTEMDLGKYPYMPYRDNLVVIVDIAKLKDYLSKS